jgi:hypothetical protein
VLVGARDGGHRRGGRQDRDDHRSMRRGLDLEGERRQQREADDDPRRHDRKRAHLRPARPRRPRDREVGGGEQRGARRAPEGDHPRIEVGDGQARRGQREGEAEDAERAEHEPWGQRHAKPHRDRRPHRDVRRAATAPCRYPLQRDSVIPLAHAQR